MKITEQQFFDYMYCPLKYYLKHKSKLVIDENETINSILLTMTKFFYTSITNGKIPTLKQMQAKLDGLCEKNKEIITSKKAVEMWAHIYNFYNWACDNKVSVIDIDSRYALPLGEHVLEGVMNPIAINKNGELEILITNFSSKVPEQIELDMKYKHTIDIFAFNTSNEEYKISGVKLHNVKQNKDMFTTRNLNDFERLKSSVDNVVKSIQNDLYYPRETYLCNSCKYKHYCRAWK